MGCLTQTYVLKRLESALEIARELKYYWFRGHPETYGELTPGMYRREFLEIAWECSEVRYLETNATMQFRRAAGSFSGTLPDPDNHLDWLVLMQHYALPTRLLDWSESVLVGLFFAVRSHPDTDDKDGELWAMFPPALNQLTMGPDAKLPLPGEPNLLYLASEAMGVDRIECLKRLRLEKSPRAPVAFEPRLAFPRMPAQSSTFTIHPDPTWQMQFLSSGKSVDLAKQEKPHTITTALRDESHLVRYVIPASVKQDIWNDLLRLGINERLLFQDLEALSRDIRAELLSRQTYGESTPPAADGEWETGES